MSERDAEIERLEIRVTELESENSVLFREGAKLAGEVDAVRIELAEAMAMLEKGRALVQDFIGRLDKMEQWEAQMQRCREWAGGPEAPET